VFDDVQTVFSTRFVGTVNPRFNETPSRGPNFGVWVFDVYLTSPVEIPTIRVNTCKFWEKIWNIFLLIFVEFVDNVTVQKANFLTCRNLSAALEKRIWDSVFDVILVFAFSGKTFPQHIFNKSSSLNIFSSSLKLISLGIKKG